MFTTPPQESRRAASAPLDRVIRLDHTAETAPRGVTLVTAIPFAQGEVLNINEIGADMPVTLEPVERHRDGSVKWARAEIRPEWKTTKGVTLHLDRSGVRPPPPEAAFPPPPTLQLTLTDAAGVIRRATVGPFTTISDSRLRRVLRADGYHLLDPNAPLPQAAVDAGGAPPRLLQYTCYIQQFPGEAFSFVTVVLRNDPPSSPPGAVRFGSYQMECSDAGARIAVAFARENDIPQDPRTTGERAVMLLPTGIRDPWLGDGQTKMWRCVVDGSGDTRRLVSLLKLLENPVLPGITPAAFIATRAFGLRGDVVLGPPPSSSLKLATADADRARSKFEYGWAGPWGDYKDTHQTGSPRNGLASEGVLRTIQTGHREWFDIAWRKTSQHALRPMIRSIDAREHPDLLLFEGMPHPKWKDRLGRGEPADPRLGPLKQDLSGTYRRETHGWNGFDHEHFTIDDLESVYLLTGDPWLRSELAAIGEALLTYDFAKKPVTTKSSRGDGWVLRGLCQLYQRLGDGRFLDAARSLVAGMESERGKGNLKYLHESSPDPRQLANHPFEMPWQVAIAILGLADYYEISADTLAKTILVDLADFLCNDAWTPARGGFKRAIATDGSGEFIDEKDPAGTQSWIAPALVAAYRIEPRPEYMILADGLYRHVKSSNATFERGGIQWTWWQGYLRHTYDGGRAVK